MALLGKPEVSLRAPIAALLLACLALAGCIDEGKTGTDGPGAGGGTGPSVPTATVQGYVLTPTFTPLPNATVTSLDDPNLTTLSAKDGFWSIAGVPAGSVAFQAELLGYETDTRSTVVQAGQVKNLSFYLEPIRIEVIEAAYQDHRHFGGFIACGVAATSRNTNHACNDPNHKDTFNVDAAVNLKGIVFEAEWTHGLAATGDNMDFRVNSSTWRNVKSFQWWFDNQASGDTFAISEEMLVAANPPYDLPNYDLLVDQVNFTIQAYVAKPAGVAYQRSFEIWVSLFYVDAPPAGFSPKAAYNGDGA